MALASKQGNQTTTHFGACETSQNATVVNLSFLPIKAWFTSTAEERGRL